MPVRNPAGIGSGNSPWVAVSPVAGADSTRETVGRVLKNASICFYGLGQRALPSRKNGTVPNETHNPLFVDHFREYVEKKLGESFDGLNDVVRSKFMSRFFAEKVLAPRNPIIPTIEEDVLACIVDGTNDQGVDFICREDGVVLIIQAKFSGGGRKAAKRRPEVAADFEYFRNVLNLLQDFRSRQMAETLRDICAEIDWDRDRFQLYYITLRQLTTDQANTKEWTALPVDGVQRGPS